MRIAMIVFAIFAALTAEASPGGLAFLGLVACTTGVRDFYAHQIDRCAATYPETSQRARKALSNWEDRNRLEIPRMSARCESELRRMGSNSSDHETQLKEWQKIVSEGLAAERSKPANIKDCEEALSLIENPKYDLVHILARDKK